MTSDECRVADRLGLSRLALGIVTYNNPAEQLRRLLDSIVKAAGRLEADRLGAAIYTIDCGEPADWRREGIKIPFQSLAPRGTWASAAG